MPDADQAVIDALAGRIDPHDPDVKEKARLLAEILLHLGGEGADTFAEGGHCKPGERSDLTGCVPAEGGGGGKAPLPAKQAAGKAAPAQPLPGAQQPARVPEEKPSAKAERARASAKRVDKTIQRYAEEHNEPRVAKALGGRSLPDSEPADVETDSDAVELKTMVDNKNSKLTMDKYAQVRKIVHEQEQGKTFHTIVSDDHEVFNALGEGKHDDSKRVYYYRRGVAGSARVPGMLRVGSEDEVKRLMALPEDQLPEAARRTDGKLREGKWTFFEDEQGKGYRNDTTGDVARPKK